LTDGARVLSEGDLSRPIMFIGEAPAASEVRFGRPFVGRAGKEQDRLNILAGIQRDDAFWTNVIGERVPGDEISSFINLAKKPSHEHFIDWVEGRIEEVPAGVNPRALPYLQELFRDVKAFRGNVIVPLGNVPLWCLTGLAAITKRRGSILSAFHKKVVPCMHPSAILRMFSTIETRIALFDLLRVKEESKSPQIILPKRELIIYPTFESYSAFIEECFEQTAVGFDIECMKTAEGGKEVSCFALAVSPARSMCVPLHSKGRSYWDDSQEVLVFEKLASVLESKDLTKVGQNIIFDSSFIYRKYGILIDPVEDTMIAQSVRYPDSVQKEDSGSMDNVLRESKRKKPHNFRRGLDFLCHFYTREPYYKDEGKEWGVVGGNQEADFYRYNAKDAAVVLDILPVLFERLKLQDKVNKKGAI